MMVEETVLDDVMTCDHSYDTRQWESYFQGDSSLAYVGKRNFRVGYILEGYMCLYLIYTIASVDYN